MPGSSWTVFGHLCHIQIVLHYVVAWRVGGGDADCMGMDNSKIMGTYKSNTQEESQRGSRNSFSEKSKQI